MPSIDDWIDQGLQAHQTGRLDEAEAAYRHALELEPEHPDALNLLGVLTLQRGAVDEAIRLLDRAVLADPDAADFHANLAEAHRTAGHFTRAIDAYAKSAHLDGTNAAVWANLATVLQQSLRFAEAVGAWKHAVETDPTSADYCNNYGRALYHADRPAESIPWLKKACELKPGFEAALVNLAESYVRIGDLDQAIATARLHVDQRPEDAVAWTFYAATLNDADRPHEALDAARTAISLDPSSARAHFVMGQTLEKMGESAGASLAFARVTELRPDLAPGHANLGLTALASGRLDQAEAALLEATQVNPLFPEAWFNLAVLYDRTGEFEKGIDAGEKARAARPGWAAASSMIGYLQLKLGRHREADAEFRRALEEQPGFVPALAGLGCVHGDRGDQESARALLAEALAIEPMDAKAHSVFLMSLVASGKATPDEIVAQHRVFGATFDRLARAFPNTREPERRIRVGYLSPDLRAHSVAFFLSGLLQRHDHAAFEVIAYDDTAKPDVVSQLLRAYCDRWHRVVGMTDDRLEELILEHEVDILVDLAGHTSSNRLALFGRKVAPVQVNYLGYPATTGLKSMDYRFTDALADPPGMTDAHHTEALVRLPDSFLAYSAPPHAPDVTDLPAAANGYITFASFNNTSKLHPGVYALWAKVMDAIPNSRLILKANGFADAVLRERVTQLFADAGIAADRLTILPKTVTMLDHLTVYGRCDVALDCFPYNGTTTTCEAVWMGLPVLTIEGQMHAGRVGVSLMTNVGMPDWIAQSPEEYVDIAAKKSADVIALAQTRRTMRERMLGSPVMDATSLARNIEAEYRQMWRRWCANFV